MMKNKGLWVLPLLLLLSAMVSADEGPPDVRFRTLLYYYPGVTDHGMSTLADHFSGYEVVETLPERAEKPLLRFRLLEEDAINDTFPVPDLQYLSYFGRGLSKAQAQRIQKSERAVLIDVAYPRALARQSLKSASTGILKAVNPDDALIWDSATRELFSVAAWKEARIEAWHDGVPLMEQQTVIHAYQGDHGGVRAITLGMEKLGLPDIVVNNFSWSLNDEVGGLINLVAQSLAEGVVPNENGLLEIDIDALAPSPYKDALRDRLHDNAEQKVMLAIGEAEWEEGDPHNFLIELRFDTEAGETLGEQQDGLLSRLFGWEDAISYVKHNEEIEAASARARKKLNGLRRDFNNGLAPGEFILVKAPFDTPDGGTEWMWVEVAAWKGDEITGLLKNEPYHIPTLRGGATVTVSQKEVFDYLHTLPDGSSQGNETGELIMRYQQ